MSQKNLWAMLLGISDGDWKRMRDGFQKIPDSVINIRNQIEDLGHKVSVFIEDNRSKIEKVLEILQNKTFIEKMFSEYLSATHKKLIQNGYFVGLAGWGFGYTNELKKLLDEDRKDEIEEYLLNLLRDKDNMKHIAQKWDRNKYFKNRNKFLLRGLKAHLEEDFIVSIPVLLPHIEAILAEFFVDNGLLSEVPDKFQGNTALNILKTVSVDEICTELDRTYFRRFLNKKGVYDFKDKDSSYLNRGQILHGTCLKYDREDWSAQLVYLLDFLCDFSTKKWTLSTTGKGVRTLKKE